MPTWLVAPEGRLAPPDPAHELPHPPAADADPMTTETYWFCFMDRARRIAGLYMDGICAPLLVIKLAKTAYHYAVGT